MHNVGVAYVHLNTKVKAIKRLMAGEAAATLASEVGVTAAEVKSWKSEFESAGKARLKERFPAPSTRKKPPPDPSISSVAEALEYAGPKPDQANTTYGRYLSDALAQVFANALRAHGFEGVLPDQHGRGLESRALTSQGFKKLDVNYSTTELGLGLGISIKSISFPDGSSGRYTKNYSRNDNELRAEAMDYHQRQPYSVLAACLFLPIDSCDDGAEGTGDEAGISSFGAAAKYFARRSPRRRPDAEVDLFEKMYLGLYDEDGNAQFYDVESGLPPKDRRPSCGETFSFAEMIDGVVAVYNERNNPAWESG